MGAGVKITPVGRVVIKGYEVRFMPGLSPPKAVLNQVGGESVLIGHFGVIDDNKMVIVMCEDPAAIWKMSDADVDFAIMLANSIVDRPPGPWVFGHAKCESAKVCILFGGLGNDPPVGLGKVAVYNNQVVIIPNAQ